MIENGVPADASAIIYLAKAGGLAPASARFGPLLIPPAVWAEVVIAGTRVGRAEVAVVESALEARQIRRVPLDAAARRRARAIARQFGLGAGESEVLSLASKFDLVLMDEHRATRAAKILGLASLETALVPALCVQGGVLDAVARLQLLDAIGRHTKVRVELAIRVRQLIEEATP